jgi:hypothetical protein
MWLYSMDEMMQVVERCRKEKSFHTIICIRKSSVEDCGEETKYKRCSKIHTYVVDEAFSP